MPAAGGLPAAATGVVGWGESKSIESNPDSVRSSTGSGSGYSDGYGDGYGDGFPDGSGDGFDPRK